MSFGERTLFSRVTLSLEKGEKAVLTGPNGCGKTTLLRIITGELEPTEGEVIFRGKNVGYIKQFRVEEDRTVYAEGLSVFSKALNAYEKAVKSAENLDLNSYESYLQKAELLDVYVAEKKVKKMLKGVGFSEEEFARKISTLSAGEITRLQLAKLLISEPELLILDEPGNYLDVFGIIFLKNALMSVKSSVLMATHDRTLMESIPDEIWDMDFGTIKSYKGKYRDFLIQKDVYIKENKNKEKSLSKEIKHLHNVVERYRRWGREKAVKQARSKEKIIQKLSQEREKYELTPNKKFDKLKLDVKKATEDIVLKVENLKIHAGSKYIGTFRFEVKNGEKVALLGKNGVGKTTLLKSIIRKPANVIFGPNTKLAYIDTVGDKRDERTLISAIWEMVRSWPDYEVRKYLGRFGFKGEDVFKTLSSLSGGEFVRFEISKALLKNPNFLIMDEPTNHLDIYMIEALEDSLKNYEGTLLFSTHDLEFADHIATRFLVMTDGNIQSFQSYDEAVAFIQEAFISKTSEKGTNTTDYEKRKSMKNRLKSLENKLQKLERRFEELDKESRKMSDEMALYASDHVKLAEMMSVKEEIEMEMEKVIREIDELEEEKKILEEEVK